MQYCAYLQKNIMNQVLISANKNVRVFNNKDIKCCTSRIITAAQKVLFRFINDFAQSPSNQQAKLKSIKTYKQKCCMKCFLSIHLSYPSHIFLRREIQVYSEFTLKEPYLVPFFLPFHYI